MSREEDVLRAMERAGRFIRYRPRSVREVENKLREVGFDDAVIAEAVAGLKDILLLDDAVFARAWAAERIGDRKLGTGRVRAELLRKGVPDDVVREALDEASGGGDEVFRALEFLRLKFRKGSPGKEPQKLVALLARQGYSFDAAGKAVRQFSGESVIGSEPAEGED
jgi:regulatory protein